MLIEKILFKNFEKIIELNHRNNLNTLQKTIGKIYGKKSSFLIK